MHASDLAPELERLDRAVEAAIRAGEAGELQVLGYGEITLVLAWPPETPTLAVKRLPGFRDRAQLDRYAALVARYIARLRVQGVPVVTTDVLPVVAPGGELHAYLVQPLVPVERQLNHLLRRDGDDRSRTLLERVVDHVADVVDEDVGLDAQTANWAIDGDSLACFDVSTPMLRDAEGHEELDLSPFLSIYPWALRGVLGPVAHGIMRQYHDPRSVLVDVASNLVKERLERWLPRFLAAANERVAPAITDREVRRYFARDKRLWLLMQRLRRADRAWQRRVRHRPYPFLLAPPYRYEPHPLPERKAA